MTSQIDKLDNPVWWSLSTRHQSISEKNGSAYMMQNGFGPFAATAGAETGQIGDFLAMIAGRKTSALTFINGLPFGENVSPTGKGVQLVADKVAGASKTVETEVLEDTDALQMFNLAQRARPGPFAVRTHQLGDFIGIKRNGRLIAMAGQRLKLPGYTEISAVCVDSEFRGQGLGTALVLEMAERIMARDDIPFLHTYADNAGAIALYQRLGFRIRTELNITVWDCAKIEELSTAISNSERFRSRLAV